MSHTLAAEPVEIELKFQIPPARQAAVQRAVGTASAQTLRLRARYFDTPERTLAAAGFALRLRQEGRRWVQTLKGRGDGLMQRLEHEVVLPPGAAAQLSLARHAGTAAGTALQALLDAAPGGAPSLAVAYETDVQRTRREVRHGGARIEVALDIGVIRAGGARLALHEIEFELLSGAPAALLALAGRWVERHGLWLDVRSKAERGDRLARGLARVSATPASEPTLHATMTPAAVVRSLVTSALAQVLPNVAEIADGRGEPEHLHQARVGLRRLRSVLGLFGDLLPAPPPASPLDRLRTLFGELGRHRDRDALAESLWPALQAAGAPALPDLSADDGAATPVDALLREPATTQLWLALLGLLHGPDTAATAPDADGGLDTPPPPAGPHGPDGPSVSMTAVARARIAHLHRRVARDAARFGGLDDEARHALRKRLKRLRYAVDLLASLTRRQRARRYLSQLAPAQDALGHFNDLCVAEALCRDRAEQGEPGAWFALGWLAAQRPGVLDAAAQALRRLPDAPDFWPNA